MEFPSLGANLIEVTLGHQQFFLDVLQALRQLHPFLFGSLQNGFQALVLAAQPFVFFFFSFLTGWPSRFWLFGRSG